MKIETHKIWGQDDTVSLTSFINDNSDSKPSVIILPGGGYHICAPNEGEPVARRFAEMGYAAFVLSYSVLHCGKYQNSENPHTVFPEPLLELAASISYIRCNSSSFGVDPTKIVLMGFSAGGHLAACYGNMWNRSEICSPLGLTAEDIKPSALIIGYGATELSSDGMMTPAVFGRHDEYTPEMLREYSGIEHIGSQTPPVMLWHSITDPMVPVQVTLDMAQALENVGVSYEVHLFGCGGHAYGLGEGKPAGAWVSLADTFIKGVLNQPELYDKKHVASLGSFGE